jgi:hypothetical protein
VGQQEVQWRCARRRPRLRAVWNGMTDTEVEQPTRYHSKDRTCVLTYIRLRTKVRQWNKLLQWHM